MIWRILSFFCFQLAGGLVAWLAAAPTHVLATELEAAMVGLLMGGLIWFLIDLAHGGRVLRWLRAGDFSDVAIRAGLSPYGQLINVTKMCRHSNS